MCPDDTTLVAMLERALDPAVVLELEVHFDSCQRCHDLVHVLGSRPLAHGTPGSWLPDATDAGAGAPVAEAPPVLCTIGGRYEVRRLLGHGGMGAVYLARDLTLDREVAVKLHRAGSGDHRLQREALAMAKLAHPNVVTVFEIGSVDDQLFVAMEYVRGSTLRDWLAATTRPWRETLALLVEAGAGLAAAHAAGLVHRDFKPDNVLVGDDGRPRVGDFGLVRIGSVDGASGAAPAARAAWLPDANLETWDAMSGAAAGTADGALVGTPAYMSPEQLVGEPFDARCDQFTFCVVAWESLYGVRPFAGPTIAAIRAAMAVPELAPPPRSDVPDRVRRALARGLAIDPAGRYADMPALLGALRRAAAPRTRSRVAISLAVGAVVVGAAIPIAFAVDDHRNAVACADAADGVRAVFGPSRRAAVEQALMADGAPYAAAAFDRTSDVLARYTETLARSTNAVCQGGDETAAIKAARRTCLAERTSELAGVVAALARPVPGAALRAPDAAWSIYDATPCDEPRLEPALSIAPADRDALGQAKGLVDTGRYEAAIASATTLADAAHGRGDRALELAAVLVLGRAEVSLEAAEPAASALYRAQALAEALGRDLDAAAALGELAGLAGLTERDYTAAHRDLDLARAKLERLGDGNLIARGALFATEAQILMDENRLAEADVAIHRAVVTLEAAYGIDHPTLGATVAVASQVAQFLGKHDEALAAGERALRILEETLGAQHPTVAGARMTVASALVEVGRQAEARDQLRAADAVFAAALGANHPARAAAAGTLGGLEQTLGNWDAALVAFRDALGILERSEGPGSASASGARRDIARTLAASGRIEEALAETGRAIAILEELGPDGASRLRGALVELAELQLARETDAVPAAQRAMALAAEHPDATSPDELAETRFVLARALWASNRERARAVALARDAGAVTEQPDDRRAEIAAWLAEHR